MTEQTFIQIDPERSLDIEQFPGAKFFPLAEPVSQGSIHLLTMNGVVETGGKTCSSGIFWFTPAHTQQRPHIAITDVEILTIRLGQMGVFKSP
jgi:hypothetical protein